MRHPINCGQGTALATGIRYFISYEKLCSNKDYWFHIQEISKIEEPYEFEFKESKKNISFDIEKELKEKSIYLYKDLNSLNLNQNLL